MDRLIDELMDEARQLMLGVGPELRDRPLYLLRDCELPADLPRTGGCLAWADAGASTDLVLIDALGPRYEGPGATVVFYDDLISKAAGPGGFRGAFLTVAIHEAGHLFPQPRKIADVPSSPQLEAYHLEKLRAFCASGGPEPDVDDGHCWRWIRRTMHLYIRARALGWEVPIDCLLSNPVHHERVYLDMLLGEALKMQHERLAVIEQEPAPAGLVETYQDDIRRYIAYTTKGKAKC